MKNSSASDRSIGAATVWRSGAWARLPKLYRRCARDNSAATLVEFGLIAAPFFLLLFAVFQQGLLFFEQETFQTAVTDASRLVYTGQAGAANYTNQKFKQAICNELPIFMPCSTISVNVQPYADFGSAQVTMPVDSNGHYDPTKATYDGGSAGSIVVVSGYALEPVLFPPMNAFYSNAGTGNVLISASAVFKNEPWQ